MTIIFVFSSPELKRFCSWSSDSQELEPFSQGSNYSDSSNPSVRKGVLKIEVERKSKKLNILSDFLSEINIPLHDSLRPLNTRVIDYMHEIIDLYLFTPGHKLRNK